MTVACPKCPGTMVRCTYGREVEVLRCDGCHGIFSDPSVLPVFRSTWLSEILDIGDPATGKRLDDVRDIKCPACGGQMHTAPDQRQKHISYEICITCEGVYFDAGEFSDWKYETYIDRLRDLVARDKRGNRR